MKAKGGEGLARENGKSANGTNSSTRPPLAHLDGYFPLLKEKRERRGERRMCRMQFHDGRRDVCEEDSCCFPRGRALLVASHKETIFVVGAVIALRFREFYS